MNQAHNSRHTYFQSPAELLIHPAPWGREDGGGNVTLWQESCDRQPSQQLRLGDGSWSPDPTDGPCGLAIDLKRRGKKKRQLLHSGFADAERTDLPAGSSAINWMSYSSVGYGFGISLTVLEKRYGAEPRWMRGPGWGPGGADMLFSGAAEGGMEEPSLGADNLGRVRSSPNSGRVPPGCVREIHGCGKHVLQPPAAEGLEVEQGKGDGNWVTGGSFHWEGGRNWEFPSSAGRGAMLSESGNDFQAANIPFQPQSCHKNPHCSCRQLALTALASLGCCGSARVSWTHRQPARRGTGILILAHEDHLDIAHQKMKQSEVAPNRFIWAGYECSQPGMRPQSQRCRLLPPGWIWPGSASAVQETQAF